MIRYNRKSSVVSSSSIPTKTPRCKTVRFSSILTLSRTAVLVAAASLVASCSVVSVNQLTPRQAIDRSRGNIVTTDQLSNQTLSRLISAGVSERECLDDIDACIHYLQDISINKNMQSLATYAELHLAKAREINRNEFCQEPIDRPPLDPNFANAPRSKTELAALNKLRLYCAQEYRTQLLGAIKYSYAHLFFDELDKEDDNSALSQSVIGTGNLPTHTAIQVQDIYDVASDTLIKYLYNNRSKNYFVNSTTVYIEPKLAPPDSISNLMKTPNDEKLIKLLRYDFTPLAGLDDQQPINNTSSKLDAYKDDEPNQEPVTIDIYLPNDPLYLQNTEKNNQGFDKVYTSNELDFKGLNTVSRRDGIGVSYVVLFNERIQTTIKGILQQQNEKLNVESPAERIHLTGSLLATGVVIPKATSVMGVLNSNDFDIKLYDSRDNRTIDILGKPYQLDANFSASYGMWLAENKLDSVGYFSLLSPQQTLKLPQLFMLEPYDPNKRVIIMLHGLASSPTTWVSITNDISNDPVLRNNYQVWQVFYPTNIPILENRYRIHQLIKTAYKQFDPQGNNIASQHSVIIGHSMGGVIGRMLVSNDNLEKRLPAIVNNERNTMLNQSISQQLRQNKLLNRLHLEQIDNVDTAVFVSAPFRGTDFADRRFTRALRRIIQLPIGFAQTITTNLASIASEGELAENPLGALYLQNGASQLSAKSSLIKLTADLDIADDVTYHSIMAHRDNEIYQGLKALKIIEEPSIDTTNDSVSPDDTSLPSMGLSKKGEVDGPQSVSSHISDGIVPYESAHLDGAASETIISGGHGIHETPEAVLALRRILHLHLDKHPTPKSKLEEDEMLSDAEFINLGDKQS